MRYLVCPDSFKGSMSSIVASEAIADGLRQADPGADIVLLPLADGGEGTSGIVGEALSGVFISVSTVDALGREIKSGWWKADIGGRSVAILDVASASGLTLIDSKERDIMSATSIGTGIIIRSALEAGVKDFIIGLGGSATNDGGLGILEALGWRMFDAKGELLKGNGEGLTRVAALLPPENITYSGIRIKLLCDVKNSFYGPAGAACVFASQKGANEKDISILDEGLRNLNRLFVSLGGEDVSSMPGAGAAGGIGGMFLSLFGAEMRSGIDEVLDLCRFEELLDNADFVITGEGRIDSQTLGGKTLSGVVDRVKDRRVGLIGFCGSLDHSAVEKLISAGFTSIYPITQVGESLSEAMQPEIARRNLVKAVKKWVGDRGLK